MQVADLVELARKEKLPPLQRRVLDYLEEHSDEIFEYRDEQLTRAVGSKPSSLGFSLWTLHKKDLIDRQEAAGKVYFGSKKAIAELRSQLGLTKGDPFERASRNRQRIKELVGNIDTHALLDETRQGR